MKRDMDLVRLILLQMEALPTVGPFPDFAVDGYPAPVVHYHLGIMAEAGLIAVNRAGTFGNLARIWPVRLTWAGHEFLDAGRNEERWQTAKSVAAKLGNASLEVVSSILTELAKQQLGRLLGP